MKTNRNNWYLAAPIALILAAPLAASAEEGTFDSAGVPIRYVDTGGDGAPVVLVHSFAASAELWDLAGITASDDFRFIALDNRGHGESGKPEGPDAYGIEMVNDVVRLMDELDIEDAHFVGYSLGAEIALKLTVEHPELARSLTIAGSGWSGEPEYETYQFIGMSVGDAASFADWIRNMSPEMSDEEFGFLVGMLEMHGIREEGQDTGALADVAMATNQLIDLTTEEIAAIAVPVLGISGELDVERPNLEKIEGVAPDFTMVVIPGADHLDAPLDPLFAETVLTFLAEQD